MRGVLCKKIVKPLADCRTKEFLDPNQSPGIYVAFNGNWPCQLIQTMRMMKCYFIVYRKFGSITSHALNQQLKFERKRSVLTCPAYFSYSQKRVIEL